MLFVLAAPVLAGAPDRSIFPVPRPGSEVASRPQFAVFIHDAPGIRVSPRPVPRPRALRVERRVAAAAIAPAVPRSQPLWTSAQGGLCGVRSIKGTRANPVQGRLRGCTILNPVKVTQVEGVQLSRPATMDCPTAIALAEWVRTGVKPAIGNQGGGVAVIDVIGSYSCRTRNSRPGAKLSEHGRGRAIDISGFRLSNGDRLSVEDDWRRGRKGRTLRQIHSVACGPFGTVLGPNADRYHQDHFHLDTANHRRGGSYCR